MHFEPLGRRFEGRRGDGRSRRSRWVGLAALARGYRDREPSSTAAQELAFTLESGLTYVEHALARGLEVDYAETATLKIDLAFETDQVERSGRCASGATPTRPPRRWRDAARAPEENLMVHLLDAARADATEGEMVRALQRVFGTYYSETPMF